MKRILLLVLLLYTFPLLAQEPTIKWGPAIQHDARNLNQLQVLGIGPGNSLYTVYTENNLLTLERYDQQYQRTWAVAIAPLSPDGKRADTEALVLLNNQVYLISSVTEKYRKIIYAQQIDANGNYMPTIHELTTALPQTIVHTKAKGPRLLLVLQQQTEPQQTIVASYYGSFKSQWSVTLPIKGEITEMHMEDNGTTFILSKLPATNSPESAFYLYRFGGRNGRTSVQAIGSTAQRPLQAKMAATNGDLVIAGVTTPAPFVASLFPEPTGTFYYRFPKGRFRNYQLRYDPIDSLFLHNYKAYKPDGDHSQRLRRMQLQHLLPLTNNKMVLLGEVYAIDNNRPIPTHHTDDILVVAFDENGRAIYTTSANKHQSGSVRQVRLGSYIATTVQDSVKLLYLDFEYNYNEQNEIIMASPRAVLKEPVIVTIAPPNGKSTVKPLRNTHTGRHQQFYLIPTSAYKLNRSEFIVIGSGIRYYRIGRLRF